MLPPFIIEQIKRREERESRREERPVVELPTPPRIKRDSRPSDEAHEADRGVVVIDLG